jgi:hypothetical protein
LLLKKDRQRPPLDERWNEREFFFWTAFKWVQLVVAVTLTTYLIISLISGNDPSPSWLRIP